MNDDFIPATRKLEPVGPKANSLDSAVAVSQYHNSRVVAAGDMENGEWLIGPPHLAIDVEEVR